MFKLKKILGARCNAPEIVEITAEVTGEVRPGRFYYFSAQRIIDHDGMEYTNVFTPVESVYGESEVKRIKGYYVTGDMIFEGKLYGNAINVGVGDCVEAHLNDANLLDGVGVNDGTFAFIDSLDSYGDNGKVTFRLNL